MKKFTKTQILLAATFIESAPALAKHRYVQVIDEKPCYCFWGALTAAASGNAARGAYHNETLLPDGYCAVIPKQFHYARHEYSVQGDYIGMKAACSTAEFNDDPRTTQADVVTVLRQIAALVE